MISTCLGTGIFIWIGRRSQQVFYGEKASQEQAHIHTLPCVRHHGQLSLLAASELLHYTLAVVQKDSKCAVLPRGGACFKLKIDPTNSVCLLEEGWSLLAPQKHIMMASGHTGIDGTPCPVLGTDILSSVHSRRAAGSEKSSSCIAMCISLPAQPLLLQLFWSGKDGIASLSCPAFTHRLHNYGLV